jgi:cell division protein FtsB
MAKGEQDVLDQITVVKTESGEVVAVTSYQKMIEELRAENEALKEEVRKYEKHIAIRYLEENK